jgi:hypothetical protein
MVPPSSNSSIANIPFAATMDWDNLVRDRLEFDSIRSTFTDDEVISDTDTLINHTPPALTQYRGTRRPTIHSFRSFPPFRPNPTTSKGTKARMGDLFNKISPCELVKSWAGRILGIFRLKSGTVQDKMAEETDCNDTVF